MSELIFVKLGGSLITDKNKPRTPHLEVIKRVAVEIAAAMHTRPEMQLLIGHGSGSFGHVEAARYKVKAGNLPDWHGYAQTSAAVQQLDCIIIEALLAAGLPAVPVQPSASARCHLGELAYLNTETIAELLARRALPVIYGDVALDDTQGCTIISTEQIMCYLALHLAPQRIILAGQVAGVYNADPNYNSGASLVPELNASNYAASSDKCGEAAGMDVTGGMNSKVRLMWDLVQAMPELTVRIMSGAVPRLLQNVIADGHLTTGTLIHR